jgi:hypothetical protein
MKRNISIGNSRKIMYGHSRNIIHRVSKKLTGGSLINVKMSKLSTNTVSPFIGISANTPQMYKPMAKTSTMDTFLGSGIGVGGLSGLSFGIPVNRVTKSKNIKF